MKKLILFMALAIGVVSCVDLDVEPKNIVTSDKLLSDESGMECN